jgi:hypothetical protein
MNAYVTRDSVCAGDDIDAPHARQIFVPDGLTVEALIRHVISEADLPDISGGKATWCISSKIPLAIIAQQWAEPKPVTFFAPKLSELDIRGDVFRAHISYFAQQDPTLVLEILARLKTHAI